MEAYAADVERAMRVYHGSLREKDRRRYAAVEAIKLGHGGVEYVAGLLDCDPKTVRRGGAELAALPEADPAGDRIRKKGAADGRLGLAALVGLRPPPPS